jgi:ABC-2 type transport system ATP-binding protein
MTDSHGVLPDPWLFFFPRREIAFHHKPATGTSAPHLRGILTLVGFSFHWRNKTMATQEAIIVTDVYKKFGKPGDPLWKRMSKPKATQNGNGNGTKNGNKKETIAVNKVTFQVREGEIFGVLGPNGSGKSTLIRLMATLLLPDEGQLQIFGFDVVRNPLEVQRLINRVSVEASFFKKLSPMENLMYGARLYGMPGAETKKQVVEILNPMEEMSRGMQQKVAIARALLSRPKVLLLDEPTTGLDPRSKREVQAVIEELRDQYGTTMVLTTHDMHEADVLCDRVAIMDKGDVVALDTPENLKKLVPNTNGHETTLEDVFMELTGRKLKDEDNPE